MQCNAALMLLFTDDTNALLLCALLWITFIGITLYLQGCNCEKLLAVTDESLQRLGAVDKRG